MPQYMADQQQQRVETAGVLINLLALQEPINHMGVQSGEVRLHELDYETVLAQPYKVVQYI